MKISIITATYNNEKTIRTTIESVISQTYNNIEYIIIDGASKDGTLKIAQEYEYRIKIFSEPDNGIYDALNKGVKHSTGEVVGFIHADDLLADNTIIEQVAKAFENKNLKLLYGDLHYVNSDNTKVIRDWKSCNYNKKLLTRGWMPAHPTLYMRRDIYETRGLFDTDFKISADYDLILRVFNSVNEKEVVYLPYVMVKMRVGGVSNNSISNILQKMREDFKALKNNNIKGKLLVLFYKNVSKIPQLILKKR